MIKVGRVMKYGLIGCGRISPNHIAAAIKNNLNIVAFCDLDIKKCEKLKSDFFLTNVNIYSSYEEMITEENIDLISIATESGKHSKIALYCIKNNINLIIEKPIALSTKDASSIIEEAQKKNLKVSVCHQNRFNKSIKKVREAVETKRFGKMFYGTAHIRWNRGESYYDQAKWRGSWEQDGGALMNQCIHNIDLLIWMMNSEIKEVFAYTDNLAHPYIEAEDIGLAIIRFANGSYGLIEGTTNIFPNNLEETLYLFGEKGTVKVGGKSVNKIDNWIFTDELDNADEIVAHYQENPDNIYGYGHNPLFADVIDSINKDRAPYIDAISGKKALEVILAIYKSSFEGQTVKFPISDIASIDFAKRKS